MQLSAFIENGREEAKDDPVEERAHDIANNSEQARITAAKNQRSYGSQTIMVEETIDTLNQRDDPQENSHTMNNIGSAGETRPPLLENQYSLSHSSAFAAALEGVPVSETQPEGRNHFRLTQNGWEKRRRDANGAFLGNWEQASVRSYVRRTNPEELQRSALASFSQAYNRADNIARKKSLYERELQSLEPSSGRAQFLTKLIPLFDQAIAYQNNIMAQLQPRNEENKGLLSENQEERVAAERQAALRDSIRIENIMTINSRPNEVERLIEQIEKEESERLDAQNQLTQVEAMLGNPDRPEEILLFLGQTAENFRSAIDLYPELIQARFNSARLIKPPYKKIEELDPAIQDKIQASKKDLLQRQVLAHSAYRFGKICNAMAISVINNRSHESFLYANCILYQSDCFVQARIEVEREEPRQAVIDLYFRAADAFEKADVAFDNQEDPNGDLRAEYLKNAGSSLFSAALEAQREQSREVVIDYYVRAADAFEKADVAFDNQEDPNGDLRAEYLKNAGSSLFSAALEAQREQSREVVIDYYVRAADAFKKADAAFDNQEDPNRAQRAEYLNNAGSSLSNAALEAGREQPREVVIDYYFRAADAFKKADAVFDNQEDPNRAQRAEYLNDEAISLYIEAAKAQGLQSIEPGTPESSATAASSTIN